MVCVSRLMPILRYVPPEYDGRKDDGDDNDPKRGAAFESDVLLNTSSRDEY